MKNTIYKLSGAINPRGAGPAVCVPAFNSSSDNYTYVQYVGIDDTVVLFEPAELSEWEPVRGNSRAKVVDPGDPAIHWVAWGDDLQHSIIDTIDAVRSEIITNRWIVDSLNNPFEKLDFAQLSGLYSWFADEAERCEDSLTQEDRELWLGETLLLGRVRFAIDSILLTRHAPPPVRRKLGLRLRLADTRIMIKEIRSSCDLYASEYIKDLDIDILQNFLQNDVAYRYANRRLYDKTSSTPVRSAAARWFKKLSSSDAQRKPSGNQRGGITLVAAGFPVDTQTYFRTEFFGNLEWVKGKTRTGKELETASVRMATSVLGNDMGILSFNVTYAPNRHSNQYNYTSVIHLGPLSDEFSQRDMSGKWLIIEKHRDGDYSMNISEDSPS